MTLRDQPLVDCVPRVRIGISKTQQVADRRAVDSQLGRDLRLRDCVAINQGCDAIRTLDRIKILSLQILDHRPFGRGSIIHLSDDGRNLRPAQRLERSPAPLASDQLVAIRSLANDDRLHQPSLLDGSGQAQNRLLIKPLARLGLVWNDIGDRDRGRDHTAGFGMPTGFQGPIRLHRRLVDRNRRTDQTSKASTKTTAHRFFLCSHDCLHARRMTDAAYRPNLNSSDSTPARHLFHVEHPDGERGGDDETKPDVPRGTHVL